MHTKHTIVQIGAAGHYEYALPCMKKYGLTLTAIASGDPEDDISRAVTDYSSFCAPVPVYDDWRRMIDETSPDIVIINSVMCHNAEMCIYAFEHHCHVFCEKPVAVDLADFNAVDAAYKRAKAEYGAVFCGMFGISYLPWFETAINAINAGAVGNIRLVSAQKSYKLGNREPYYSDRKRLGGIIPWVAIHAMDWICRMTDLRLECVTASSSTVCNGSNGELEATAAMMLECNDGKLATITADYLRPSSALTHDDDRIRIVGSAGILEVCDRKVFLTDGSGRRELDLLPQGDIFDEMLTEIEGGAKCRVNAEETLYTTYVSLVARESADTGRKLCIERN
ncbi:MAG: Gfo/Idh/MocA family oxidoreductase [Clostridia bacterium]|nr:Gfo/Idh/MocA family oxidoreductase [Clostridia bacterium]